MIDPSEYTGEAARVAVDMAKAVGSPGKGKKRSGYTTTPLKLRKQRRRNKYKSLRRRR